VKSYPQCDWKDPARKHNSAVLRAGGCAEKPKDTEEYFEGPAKQVVAKVSGCGVKKTGGAKRGVGRERTYPQIIHNTPSFGECNLI